MKQLKIIAASLLLSLGSCGIFSRPDPTPAITILFAYNENYQDTLDSFRHVIQGATGIDDVTKAKILEKIENTDKERRASYQELDEYLRSIGDIDYQGMSEAILARYLELRNGGR